MEITLAELAERHLRSQYENNLSQKIWPSNNIVIERLLQDSANLRAAWSELLEKYPCGNNAQGRCYEKWQIVLDTIVDVAAGWSPERTKRTRQAIKDVDDLTKEIQDKAHELAVLLRRRSKICETAAISKRPMDFHPIDLFGPAATIADRHEQSNGEIHCRFMSYVHGPLSELDNQFDLKYWPRTADIVEAIAEAQDDADFSVDGLSEAATSVRQASVRDFMRSLDKALGDLSRIGIEISFSHSNYAAIVNAACGLDQTESAQTVKKYRADARKRPG